MLLGIQGSGQLTDAPPDPGRFRAVAELAEELGYDSIWAGEHLSFHNPILDLGVALAAFATVTERLLLGAGSRAAAAPPSEPRREAGGVARLPLRRAAAARRRASAVRARRTSRRPASTFASVAPAPTRASWRCARCFGPAACLVLRPLPRFDGVELTPRSPRPAGPPILVGGRSDAAQRRAGALGDGWLPYLVSPRRFARRRRRRPRARAEAGRDPDALGHVLVTFARVGDDGDAAREQTRLHLSHRYRMRFEPHHVEHLCVAGTPEECAARVRAYAAAGVRHISFNPAADDDLLDQVALLRAVADLAAEAVV